MSGFDLNAVIERLAAKVANDLKDAGEAETAANAPVQDTPASFAKVNFEPVNQLEQTSLNALVCWAAANCNMTEAQIAEQLTHKFGAESIATIDQSDFDQAIAWLVDFKPVLN